MNKIQTFFAAIACFSLMWAYSISHDVEKLKDKNQLIGDRYAQLFEVLIKQEAEIMAIKSAFNGDPKKCAGKKFWDLYEEFSELTEKQQQSYYLGGGCIPFNTGEKQ